MKHTKKIMSAVLLCGMAGCLMCGVSQLNASAEGTPAWIAISANNKYTYTVDASGNQAAFQFSKANNANGKTIYVDLGMQSDGETAETEQNYVLSKIKLRAIQNITSLTVQVSTDNVTYTTAVEYSNDVGQRENVELDFVSEVNARYVQISSPNAWATMWGTDPFSFYGYAGELEINTDPQGITLEEVNAETVYPMVRGDSYQLRAHIHNAYGEGVISYALAEETEGIAISETGLLTIGAVGDGVTQYTAIVSVPNPNDADHPYTASMKFVVLAEELERHTIYYKTLGRFDLLDYVSLDMVRMFGEGTVEYSTDGLSYTALEVNKLLETPVVARYLKTDAAFALYGTTTALPVKNIATKDINGFYPSNPIENIADGNALTFAQTPNGNFLGKGESLGVITLELDGYYKISAVRVLSYWNSISGAYVSFSLDGETHNGRTPLNLKAANGNFGSDTTEYFDILLSEYDIAAKYIHLHFTDLTTQYTWTAIREFNAYGEAMPDVTVTYNANTTDEVTGMPQSGDVAFGTMIDEVEVPVRGGGYRFKGWYLDEGCEDAYDISEPVFEDITLYAKWAALHTVTFETNGGTEIAAITIEEGSAVSVSAPTKEGFAFKGWYTNEELTEAYDVDSAVTDDLALYAKWNALYTVSFEENGGSEVAAVTIENGNTLTEPTAPTREGYTFLGWFADEALNTAFDFTSQITANTTLYAKWERLTPVYTFAVTSTGSGEVLGIPYGEVEEGTVITLTLAPEEGFEVRSVKINGTETEINGLTLDVTVNEAITVEVVFGEAAPAPAPKPNGLSAGAIAAIVVCSVCAVAGAGIAVFFIVKKRKGAV